MNALITGLTDFALAAACLIFSWKLWSQHATRKDLNQSFFGLFIATALAAIAGGLRHTYPLYSHASLRAGVAVMVFAGLAAYNLWLIDVQLVLGGDRPVRLARWFFRVLFVLYLVAMWSHPRFSTVIFSYFPAAVVLFIIAVLRARNVKNRFYFFGVAGLLLCFFAAWVEITQFHFDNVYLTSDVLYDIFEGFGLWGVYLFGSRVSRLASL